MRHSRGLFFIVGSVCALLASGVAGAESYPPTPSYDPTATTKWRESALTLPAYPAEAKLVPVPLAAGDTFKLYVDRDSLSLGDDRVLRLTFVIESPHGARNVFHEGIRCETREHKTYAVGTHNRNWSPVTQARWQFIYPAEYNGFRYHLYKHYVCDETSSARAPAAFLQAVSNIAAGQ